MAKTKTISSSVVYKRTPTKMGKKLIPVKKTVSRGKTKVMKPSTNSIIEGIKDERLKAKVLQTKEKQNTLRMLGTETASNIAQAIGTVGSNIKNDSTQKQATSNVMNSMNQNINGGAVTSGDTRDDDEGETQDDWSGVY